MVSSKITATGFYLPVRIVRNEDFKQFPVAAIPLIAAKTGVLERRHAAEDECTSSLAANACRQCLDRAGVDPKEIDSIILATSSPDRSIPATATRVQQEIGAVNAYAFDINSVCAGAPFGLGIADALIRSGQAKKVLVVASEVYSRILNPTDFTTYPYFGDGAAAVLVVGMEGTKCDGIVASSLHSDGSGADVIQIPAGGSMCPLSGVKDPKAIYFKMDGRAVYDFAVKTGPLVLRAVAEKARVSLKDVRHFVLHQANINILRKIAESVEIPMERFVVNLNRYGNTAAASVLIALDQIVTEGSVKRGDLVAIAAFGGGLSWGGTIIRF